MAQFLENIQLKKFNLQGEKSVKRKEEITQVSCLYCELLAEFKGKL